MSREFLAVCRIEKTLRKSKKVARALRNGKTRILTFDYQETLREVRQLLCPPECPEDLIYETGNISDICHIEALNPGGPRYNSSPEITDKDRNGEPNLILLCKNHHHIIDQTDDDGTPHFSVEQLKAMKREHEQRFSDARQQLFSSKRQSLLAQIVRALSSTRHEVTSPKAVTSFEIEAKIAFNEIDRYYGIVGKFAAYSPLLDRLYDELESAQFEDVLSSLNTLYLISRRRGETADDTLDRVRQARIRVNLSPEPLS